MRRNKDRYQDKVVTNVTFISIKRIVSPKSKTVFFEMESESGHTLTSKFFPTITLGEETTVGITYDKTYNEWKLLEIV